MDQIATLLRLFGPRATKTVERPNAWAIISAWRRYFQQQDAKEQEEIRQVEEILDQVFSSEVMRPIVTEENRSVRETVLQEHYRELRVLGNIYRAEQQRRVELERRPIIQPNLNIPVGDEYMSIAQ